jgi:hypothetical protein
LKEEKNVTVPLTNITVSEPIALCSCHAERSVPLSMSRINPEFASSATPDPLVPDEAGLRQEPDEEDDEEDDRKEDDEDDDNDDGYSE